MVDELGGRLDGYPLLPTARGDLLERLGRRAEARAEFGRPTRLTANQRERELLLARAQAMVE
jgi:predicted RNA polymerase sigma factor